jgi:MFS family permease
MHALYLLWWVQEKHVSPAAVASILAAGNITLVLCEVPTGWFADRFGHRASLILGSTLQIVGMLWCWLGEGVAGLTIACVLVALADAFRSGADQALIYRSCVALGREEDFQRIEARSNAAELCALVALLALGGAIVARWGFAAGWITETVLSAIGLGIACAMTEPPAHDDDEEDDAEGVRSLLSRRIALTIAPFAALSALASAAAFVAQTGNDSGTLGITVLVAILTLAEAAGSAMAARIANSNPAKAGLHGAGVGQQLMLLAAGLLLCVAAVAAPLTFETSVIGLSFLTGLAEPLRDTAIQRAAPEGARARAASLASACDMAVGAIVLPLTAFMRSRR